MGDNNSNIEYVSSNDDKYNKVDQYMEEEKHWGTVEGRIVCRRRQVVVAPPHERRRENVPGQR